MLSGGNPDLFLYPYSYDGIWLPNSMSQTFLIFFLNVSAPTPSYKNNSCCKIFQGVKKLQIIE